MILRLSFVSLQISRRALIVSAVLSLLMLSLLMLSVSMGYYPLSLTRIIAAIGDHASEVEQMIVMDHRLPRILSAVGAGAAFGLAGAMFQTMLRNPLASPDVIGFNAGAAFGALAAIVMTGANILPGALIGGLLTAAAVTALAWHNGLHPYRLILVGIGASLTLVAGADLLMSRLDSMTASEMAKWLIGTLNSRDWGDVRLIWGGLALMLPLCLWLQFPLSRLAMDDDISTSLGLALSPLRLTITTTGVALVALAVSVAGPLPFVAFVSGPIARRIVGGGKPALLASAMIGALVTLLADTLARSVPIVQLPAGVFTALIGAPVLMWLLLVQFRKGTL
ncbi:MAG: iron chelate uptake ABC transporter family permease subunit [Rhodobacteraceae bacterium]|nr:iron chelate uptake ABC transporter family permease subunit [Paracoccaceae bacterium]